MNTFSEQLKVIKTFDLKVSDEAARRFCEIASSAGMTPDELLSSFVGDLTGVCSNGSDERSLACRWMNRCGFKETREETFLTYLADTRKLDYSYESMSMILELKWEFGITEDWKERKQIERLIDSNYEELRNEYAIYMNRMKERNQPYESEGRSLYRLRKYTERLDKLLHR